MLAGQFGPVYSLQIARSAFFSLEDSLFVR